MTTVERMIQDAGSQLGGGKYERQCVALHRDLHADGVILFIVNGTLGTGFSIRANPHLAYVLPEILRDMARAIEELQGRNKKQ